jgi:hypothetical protein
MTDVYRVDEESLRMGRLVALSYHPLVLENLLARSQQ